MSPYVYRGGGEEGKETICTTSEGIRITGGARGAGVQRGGNAAEEKEVEEVEELQAVTSNSKSKNMRNCKNKI